MRKYVKPIVYIGVIAVMMLLMYFAIVTRASEVWVAFRSGDEKLLAQSLSNTGNIEGLICMGLLQFMQEISIFMSAAVIQYAAGLFYGTLKGWIVCETAYIAANILVFVLARKFSGLTELLGESNNKKIQKGVEFLRKGDPFITVMMLCILPVVPNGIVPYAASQMKLKTWSFAVAVFFGCTYPLGSMILVARCSADKNIPAIVILLGMNLVLGAVIWGFRKPISKFIDKLRVKVGGEPINMYSDSTEDKTDSAA